jgi:hypothetical protein
LTPLSQASSARGPRSHVQRMLDERSTEAGGSGHGARRVMSARTRREDAVGVASGSASAVLASTYRMMAHGCVGGASATAMEGAASQPLLESLIQLGGSQAESPQRPARVGGARARRPGSGVRPHTVRVALERRRQLVRSPLPVAGYIPPICWVLQVPRVPDAIALSPSTRTLHCRILTSVVGCWLLVVGCWLLVVGCWLLVVGC